MKKITQFQPLRTLSFLFLLVLSFVPSLQQKNEKALSIGVHTPINFTEKVKQITFTFDIDMRVVESLVLGAQALSEVQIMARLSITNSSGLITPYDDWKIINPYIEYQSNVIEHIKKERLIVETLCGTRLPVCKAHVEIEIVDKSQSIPKDYIAGSVQVFFNNITKSKIANYGPIFARDKKEKSFTAISQSYSLVLNQIKSINQYNLVVQNEVNNTQEWVAIKQHYFDDSRLFVKYQPLKKPCSTYKECQTEQWPELTAAEITGFEKLSTKNAIITDLGICRKPPCFYAVTLFIQKNNNSRVFNSFYVDVPNQQDIILLQKDKPKATFKNQLWRNEVFKYFNLNNLFVVEDNFAKFQILYNQSALTNYEANYVVTRTNQETKQHEYVGLFSNDQLAVIHPKRNIYNIFFYQNTEFPLEATALYEIGTVNQHIIRAGKESDITFKKGQRETNHLVYALEKDEEIGKVQLEFKIDNLTIENLIAYYKICEKNNECLFPYEHDKDRKIVFNGRNSTIIVADVKKSGCQDNCRVLFTVGFNNNFMPYNSVTFKIATNPYKPKGPEQTGLSPGAIVGIILGSVLVLSISGYFGFRWYRNQKLQNQVDEVVEERADSAYSELNDDNVNPSKVIDHQSYQPYQAPDANEARQESQKIEILVNPNEEEQLQE